MASKVCKKHRMESKFEFQQIKKTIQTIRPSRFGNGFESGEVDVVIDVIQEFECLICGNVEWRTLQTTNNV